MRGSYSAQVITELIRHADSWINAAIGFGGARDKTSYTTFCGIVTRLTDPTLTAMFRVEHLSAKIVDVYPREGLRAGFIVTGGDRAHADEVAAAKYLKQWRVNRHCLLASIWGRLYGGSAIWLGSRTADPALPFVMGEPIDFLRVVDRRYLVPRPYELDELGQPTWYDIVPEEGRAGLIGPIHVSRLVMFPGALTDAQTRIQNGFWDDSVLQRPYDSLKSDGTFWKSIEQLATEASIGVYKIGGLAGLLGSKENRERLVQRLEMFSISRSITKHLTLDKDSEDFTRQAAQFAGLADLNDRSLKRIASASEIPVTVLLGEAPAGLNATGDSDLRWFLMRVDAYRCQTLEDPVLYLCSALLAQSGLALADEARAQELALLWPNLWAPSSKEQAEIFALMATADTALFDRGLLSADEIRRSRFGEDGYSQETTIDQDEPDTEPDGAPEATPDPDTAPDGGVKAPTESNAGTGENVQTQVYNGAQVASMIDVVSRVHAEEIPRESGAKILEVAFGLSPEDAQAMLGPENFEPKKPDPPPMPFGATPPPAKDGPPPAPKDEPPPAKDE